MVTEAMMAPAPKYLSEPQKSPALISSVGGGYLSFSSAMGALVPPNLAEPFTTTSLADAIGQRGRVAQKMAYCLRKMGVLTPVGKQRNAILYTRAAANGSIP